MLGYNRCNNNCLYVYNLNKNNQIGVKNWKNAIKLFDYHINSATGERSFSSLRLLKTYLRNSMTQERISDLAVIYINSDIADNLNVNDIIDKFASVKNRRMQLTLTKILYYRVFFSIVFRALFMYLIY